jgi:hypothetical protein
MTKEKIEKNPTQKNLFDGIDYRELWDAFEDNSEFKSVGTWNDYYLQVIEALQKISDKVLSKAQILNDRRKNYESLGGDAPTDICWVLSIMLAKRTLDMLWMKSNHERIKQRGENRSKENCESHNILLKKYIENLQQLCSTY